MMLSYGWSLGPWPLELQAIKLCTLPRPMARVGAFKLRLLVQAGLCS